MTLKVRRLLQNTRVTIRIRALALVSSWNNKFAPVNYFRMFSPGSISAQGSFKLVLPDRMSCDVPFQEPVKYPLYKDPECYEHCLNAALLTASISEDRFCFMLEPGKNKKTLELVVPALPSSTFGFKSPRTRRLLLFSAVNLYSNNHLTYANKRYAKEIKLMNDFMFANEHSLALNFETQREVDTILASNISVTEFLEALIAEPQIRHLWVQVQGKSGTFYRLRICDTELALCREDGSATAIHVWPWKEVGEPKCRKTEVRMPWLITDERPQLTPVLADVLQSTRPENLNEAKRRKLSRTDSIPSPVVFDAKYHFTITVCVKDINSSSKLVYQITCIRAMAFANGTQPAPEPENNSVRESHLIGTNWMPTSKTRKKKGFSLCGLNCMGGKDKEEMDENRDSYPSRRSVDYTQCHLSVAEVAPSQNVQVVEPPSPPQRRRSSSVNKQAITGEGDIAKPNRSVQSSTDTNHVASIPNALVCSGSHEPMLNTTSFLSENSTSVNLSRYLTYTKSDATGQFLNEPQITSTCTPHQSQVEQAVKSTLSSFEINAPKPSHESVPNKVPQLLLSTATEKGGTTAPELMSPKSAVNVDDCTGRAQPSPVPSPKKREMSVTPSSPGRPPASPHSGIPLPRNPTRAMVGTTHHPPSPSGEVAEIEASGHSNEATLDLQAAAIDLTTALGGAVNLDQTKSGSIGITSSILHGIHITSTGLPVQDSSKPRRRGSVDTESPTSLPVPEVPVSTPTTAVPGGQNGTTKTDISTPAPIATPPPMQLAQTRRHSGLIGPKVVVNKPGISVYKGRNAPSLSSPVEMGPDGDSPNGGPITTPTLPVAPTAATVAVSAKSSNIRPPMVTTEANVTRYHPRSSIPTRSTLATRNGHDTPSTGSLQAVTVRSAPTGIRMPSQLSRQTLAK